MAAVTKKFLWLSIAALLYIKMSTKFNCSYMAIIGLTYISGFSVKIFFQTMYVNYRHILIKDHIYIPPSETTESNVW